MTLSVRDENLREYATDRQWEVLEAYWEHGSHRKAAAALGVDQALIGHQIKAVRTKAARAGYSPEHDYIHPVPDGFRLRGESILYGKDGEPKLRWVKSAADHERQLQLVEEAAQAAASDLPRATPTPVPKHEVLDHLLVGYPIADLHLGMYAWHEETGEDYDLKIAERLTFGAIDHLTGVAPPTERALVAFLGDFLHYDGQVAETPTNKNPLDADSRFAFMVRVGIRSMRYVIHSALARHRHVDVIIEAGNHDPFSSVFLREAMRAIFEDEPRATIDPSPMMVHYLEWGKNLIGIAHGHKIKLEELPLVMAADRPEAWGRTTHRTFWTGHIHQKKVLDVRGTTIESFRSLVATEAYAHQAGYRPKRELNAIVLHQDGGERARYTVNPEMLT